MSCEDLPHLIAEDDSSDYEDVEEEEDEDMVVAAEPTKCLFCLETFPSIEVAMKHVKTAHNVDFSSLRRKHKMDQYSFIKLINCLRAKSITAAELNKTAVPFWNDEIYLKPKEYESWLTFDYEDLEDSTQSTESTSNRLNGGNSENPQVTINRLQQEVEKYKERLEQAQDDMQKMRSSFQRLMNENTSVGDNESNGKSDINCVANTSLKADESYFDSYAHFGIHHEMLSDVVRTTSYRDALLENAAFIKGKTVLDVGCGTSVLSIFAAQAGAAKVIGIDNSDIIYNAMEIVRKNQINNVELIKGRLEETELSEKKFDVIISEWMGYFLLFEGMLDTIIHARDNLLKPDGVLLPSRCTMSLVGYGDESLYTQHIKFWDNVYGLDMSTMREAVKHEPLIEIVDPQHILTEANTIANFDIKTIDLNYSNFSYDFELKCTKAGKLTSLVGYFDTYFDLPVKPIHFGTGPRDKATHWKQVVFFVEQPQDLNVNDIVKGCLKCKRSCKSARSLDIEIDIFNKKHIYYLD